MQKKNINLLIWSFGNSDLYLDGKKINIKEENFLLRTKEILENFESYKDRINFPIFESFINDDNFKREENYVLKGIFTDQSGYETDTIYIKDIFNKWLNLKKTEFKNVIFSDQHIIISEARNAERIYQEIDKQLKQQIINNEKFNGIFEIDKVYVSTTGGTKQIIVSLILSILFNFDADKVKFMYGELIGNETKFRYQNIFKNWLYETQLRKIVETGNFEVIIEFIDFNKLKDNFKEVYQMAKYGYYRLLCDWKKVQNIYISLSLPSKFAIGSTEENIDILEEAINGIIYTWRLKRLAEFMGRVYNFADKIIVNNILKKITGKGDFTYNNILNLLEKFKDLELWLNNSYGKYTKEGFSYVGNKEKLQSVTGLTPIRWDCRKYNNLNNQFLNLPVGIALVDYFIDQGMLSEQYRKYLFRLQDLNQYRNKTIIGHGIAPINEQIIIEKLGVRTDKDVEQFFRDILKSIGSKNYLWIDNLKKEMLNLFN